MSKQLHDISQIRKYLNGELDARAMHRLERQAQDDPFLMDALEGYQNAKADQRANLDELASRLTMRVAEKRTRIIPLRAISIAASILVICSAGIWWLYQGREPVKSPATNEAKQPGNPLAVKQESKISVKTTSPDSAGPVAKSLAGQQTQQLSRQVPAPISVNPTVTGKPPLPGTLEPGQSIAEKKVQKPAAADSTPLNEMIVMDYSSAKKKDTSNLLAAKSGDKMYKANAPPQQQLQSQVPGVKVYPNSKSADLNRLLTSGNLGSLGINQLITNPVIQGKVIAQNNGLPIQGATIKVPGTNQATKTDARGFFRLNVDTSQTKLEVANRGYYTRQFSTGANGSDSVKTITLAPADSTDMGESIATGFTSQPRNANEIYVTAHPQKGWGAFRDYIKINAVAPDGAVGIVKLSFSVDRRGSISDVRIKKGLSAAADKKAIGLVKDGPEWTGNSNKQPETITLRIKFSKK